MAMALVDKFPDAKLLTGPSGTSVSSCAVLTDSSVPASWELAFEATESVALEEAGITLLRVPIDNPMTVANVPNTGDAPLLPTPLGG